MKRCKNVGLFAFFECDCGAMWAYYLECLEKNNGSMIGNCPSCDKVYDTKSLMQRGTLDAWATDTKTQITGMVKRQEASAMADLSA